MKAARSLAWSAWSPRRRAQRFLATRRSLAGSITIGEDFEFSDEEVDAMLDDPRARLRLDTHGTYAEPQHARALPERNREQTQTGADDVCEAIALRFGADRRHPSARRYCHLDHGRGPRRSPCRPRSPVHSPRRRPRRARPCRRPRRKASGYARRSRGTGDRPLSGWASLTPAERDVVKLAVEGLNNADIGARLFMSRHTVKTHLSHVSAELGVATRTELAVAAVERARD